MNKACLIGEGRSWNLRRALTSSVKSKKCPDCNEWSFFFFFLPHHGVGEPVPRSQPWEPRVLSWRRLDAGRSGALMALLGEDLVFWIPSPRAPTSSWNEKTRPVISLEEFQHCTREHSRAEQWNSEGPLDHDGRRVTTKYSSLASFYSSNAWERAFRSDHSPFSRWLTAENKEIFIIHLIIC